MRHRSCLLKSTIRSAILCGLISIIEPHFAFADIIDQNKPLTENCNPDSTTFYEAKLRYIHIAKCAATKTDLPPQLAIAVIEIESNFNPNARGAAGEVGLMQVMPPTARLLGFSGSLEQLKDPETNIDQGVRYLADAYRLAKGDLCTTVMKYRAGHGESRFSVRSVDYCRKARAILSREGYEVSGVLPKATFGFTSSSGVGSGNNCLRRSFKPGPGYGRCIGNSSVFSKSAIRSRRAIFQ